MSEKRIKKLELVNVVDICAKYLTQLGDEESSRDFEQLKQDLIIRNFLNIEQKEIILQKILLDICSEWILNTFAGTVELSLLFDGLLAYTNINPNLPAGIKIPEVYNLLYQVGLVDYILEFCEKDYNTVVRMTDRMTSAENIQRLIETMEFLDGEKLENLNKQFEKFTSENNLETLNAISNILAYNDPILTTSKNAIETEAYKAVKEQEAQAD